MFEDTRFAPLPGSMMIMGLLGLIISIIYSGDIGETWTFTLCLFFLILCISSFLSLQYAPIKDKEIKV